MASSDIPLSSTPPRGDQSSAPAPPSREGLLVGLTGGIASGKSTVARIFGELGAALIDADEVAREVVDGDPVVLEGIVRAFGTSVLDPSGRLDRRALGAIVFADPEARRRLEALTHPAIVARSDALARGHLEVGRRVVVYEAALLVETRRHLAMDLLVVVVAEEAVRLERLIARNQLSKEEALSRIASQMPQAQKAEAADFVVDNSGPLEETRRRVEEVWGEIQRALASRPPCQGTHGPP
jgi:dephospho-CoA kinase